MFPSCSGIQCEDRQKLHEWWQTTGKIICFLGKQVILLKNKPLFGLAYAIPLSSQVTNTSFRKWCQNYIQITSDAQMHQSNISSITYLIFCSFLLPVYSGFTSQKNKTLPIIPYVESVAGVYYIFTDVKTKTYTSVCVCVFMRVIINLWKFTNTLKISGK